VLSIDEKTGIRRPIPQNTPTGRATSRKAHRRAFESSYGTVSIIAALHVHTGQVLTETSPQ